MPKTIYCITVIDALSTPVELKTYSFYSLTDAQAAFKTKVKELMQTKLAFAYVGAHPKSGYRHVLNGQLFQFYDGSSLRPNLEVSFVQSDLFSPKETTTTVCGGAGTPVSPSGPGPGPVGPAGSVGKTPVAGSVLKSPPGVTVNLPGVGPVTIDPSVLGEAVASALGGGGTPSVGVSADEDSEEDSK